MEPRNDALYRPGQVELQVAEPYVGRPAPSRFDLYQVLEIQSHELVTVTHQNVEVGVDYRSLVAFRNPERLRADPIDLVRFLFQSLFLSRVHDLGGNSTVRRDLVFAHHVPDGRDKGSQRGVGLVADVASE